MHVVGGTYVERCVEPDWHEIYGSGLRAAASLSGHAQQVRLHTYVPDGTLANVQALAASHGCDLVPAAVGGPMVEFSYYHGLSSPAITPHPVTIQPRDPLRVKGERILRFGLIEGDAVVDGDWVVYDPQSPLAPHPFAANGSRAGKLAVIANQREAALLSGSDETEAGLATALLKAERADVAVVKRGPQGCIVAESDRCTNTPAYETDFVWPIGSGDVFAAFFAHGWMEEGLSAAASADLASRAAAWYCNCRALPVGRELDEGHGWRPVAPKGAALSSRTVYLAGPFFNMGQRWVIEEARSALTGLGVGVFSPLHDVGRGPADKVYGPDVAGIDRCDVMLACLDGLDAGTLYEVGYAQARGKPVVACVSGEPEEQLKMVRGSGCAVTGDLCTAIYKTVWTAMRL